MGGISSVMMGGDFGQGAFQGTWTSAFAMICNDFLEEKGDRQNIVDMN